MKNTLFPFLLSVLFGNLFSCTSVSSDKAYRYGGEKLKGVAFVAPRDSLEATTYQPVKQINAEWVALMPYGYTREGTADFVYVKDNEWKWWGESPRGVAHCVQMAHDRGLKVMLKPHMWIGRGTFTGHFELATEAEWQTFEKGFGEYLLDFARVADSTEVDLYCIATEMQTFVKRRPQFWFQIIRDIKKIYKGKLTYAENWDVYQDVPFWNELDYVGIDAYFPLSDEQSPDVVTLKNGWKPHLKALEKYSSKVQKPILFTEFGYMSSDFAARRPWESDRDRPANELLQARTYEAFFQEVWKQDWMAGGFVWKWFPGLGQGERARDPFSPQNKEAEKVLEKYFQENF
ncbi:glycoside hydrolase family 113 [Persicitalea jodogahamensis]|uniref:Glycoside hydrolase n=1 Tax=Persicitalea jodogahamensis TaxID=402147 RepID=A0A8J3DBX4_9BACT|nr:hypothetical protein [Persicitalea jodogahamensis]GHB80927.1 hypothetical protein GCM10007390_39450 [Persicitalea jodogahamensis]